jgi:hypothetical protein
VEDQLNVSAYSLNFEMGMHSNKYSEGFGLHHFYVWSPCNFLIEDYTEKFYAI